MQNYLYDKFKPNLKRIRLSGNSIKASLCDKWQEASGKGQEARGKPQVLDKLETHIIVVGSAVAVAAEATMLNGCFGALTWIFMLRVRNELNA